MPRPIATIAPCMAGAALILVLGAADVQADDFPRIEYEGFVDLRALRTAESVSWYDEGTGRQRVSGDREDGSRFTARFEQASATAIVHFDWDLLGIATASLRSDGDFPLNLTEAFVRYRPVSTSAWRPKVKLGAFFPPVSLENDGVGWTSPHTLTFSAINSWVGEELRTFGGEASVEYRDDFADYELLLGVFAANDPAGGVLASRGWGMHDRVTGIFDGINYLSTGDDAHHAELRPFVEIDGIPGFYAGTNIRTEDFGNFQFLYYDNMADFEDKVEGQAAWRTKFIAVGASYFAPYDIELIGQFMIGTTDSAVGQAGIWHDKVDFESGYIMASRLWETQDWGDHRLALRHDIFAMEDRSPVKRAPFGLGEDGHAITGAYTFTTPDQNHRITAEVHTHRATRPHRELFGDEADDRETIFQLGYRLMF